MNFIQAAKYYFRAILDLNYEMFYARKWDDYKKDKNWIQSLPGISPGGWAVGYNYVYVLTRILTEMRPRSVLEFGLGESTTIIAEYFKRSDFSGGKHDVIEHDEEWRDFYNRKVSVGADTKIYIAECTEKVYKGVKYNAYADIGQIVLGCKYDVISVDAPIGGSNYARRDILEYIPQVLSEKFVILVDDSQRKGEKKTIADIEKLLNSSGIKYKKGTYRGLDHTTVIASEDNKFFCTM